MRSPRPTGLRCPLRERSTTNDPSLPPFPRSRPTRGARAPAAVPRRRVRGGPRPPGSTRGSPCARRATCASRGRRRRRRGGEGRREATRDRSMSRRTIRATHATTSRERRTSALRRATLYSRDARTKRQIKKTNFILELVLAREEIRHPASPLLSSPLLSSHATLSGFGPRLGCSSLFGSSSPKSAEPRFVDASRSFITP